MEEYQAKDHHQNHHRHAPSTATPEYHTGSRPKYHTRSQRAPRRMVYKGPAEYPMYAGSPVQMTEKCSVHMGSAECPLYAGSPM
jgi:hypothetical protein